MIRRRGGFSSPGCFVAWRATLARTGEGACAHGSWVNALIDLRRSIRPGLKASYARPHRRGRLCPRDLWFPSQERAPVPTWFCPALGGEAASTAEARLFFFEFALEFSQAVDSSDRQTLAAEEDGRPLAAESEQAGQGGHNPRESGFHFAVSGEIHDFCCSAWMVSQHGGSGCSRAAGQRRNGRPPVPLPQDGRHNEECAGGGVINDGMCLRRKNLGHAIR